MIMNKILLIASAFLATIGSLTAQNTIVDSVLTIADGTTEIKSQAFYGRKDFNKVVIPSTVTKIGGLAFHNCTKLKEIEIPSSVKEIGNAAFQNDSSLTKVTLHEGLTSLNYRLFKNTAIKEIIIPSSIDSIGKEAFSNCFNLQKVVIQNGVRKIDNNAFGNSTLKTIEIPASVSVFGTNIFTKCDSLTSIRVDKYSDAHAFFNTNSLLSFTDNEPTQTKEQWIESAKYSILDDTVLYVGSSVTKIPDNQYKGNQNITEIRFTETLEKIGSNAFSKNTGLKKVVVPGNVKVVGDGAFSGCTNLEEVIIEEGVEDIKGYSFYGCKKLKSVTFPKSIKKLFTEGLFWETNSSFVLHCYAGSDAYNLALKSNYLTDIIGLYEQNADSITVLNYSGNKIIQPIDVECKNLQSIKLGNNVKKIFAKAFYDCPVENIDLDNDLKEIGENAFNDKTILRVKRGTYADSWAKQNGYYLSGVLADLNVYTKDKSKQIEEDFTRILCDDDSYANWTSYSFNTQKPLKLEEIDNKLVLTSFMLYPCQNVTVVNKEGKALINGKTIQPLTRTVLCDFDFRTDSIENFSLTTDDPFYERLVSIPTQWNISFNGFFRRSSTNKDNLCETAQPVHAREWIALIYNMAYVIGLPEYTERCYKAVENKELVTDDSLSVFLTKEDMDALLKKALKYSLVLGLCKGGYGLGGGNVLYLDNGWLLGISTSTNWKSVHAFWHEFSHCMNWGHQHGNMCNLERPAPWGEQCWPSIASKLYVEELEKGNPPYIEGKTFFNSKLFSNEKLVPTVIDSDSIKGDTLYITDGIPYVDSHKNETDFTKAIIPSSVEVIKNSAFYGTRVSEIEIPSSVKKIENLAFHSCTDLKSIVIPDNVKTIGDAAFQNDSSLTSAVIGSGLRELNYRLFKNTGLTEINIPANIKVIGKEAFADCKNLKTIVIADGVQKIDNNAFYNTGIEKIEVPASVTEFGKNITSKKVVWIVKRGSAAYYYALGNNYPIELLPEPEDEVVAQIIAESESAEFAPTEGWQTGDYTSGYERRRWDFSNELKGAGKYTITFKYKSGACMLCLADALFVADGNAIGHFFDMRSAGANPRQIVYEITVPAGTEKLELLALAKTSGGVESNGTMTVDYLGNGNSCVLTKVDNHKVTIYNQNRIIIVENATDEICVYDILGQLICRYAMPTIHTEIPVNKDGLYIVKTGNSIGKLYIK